MCLFFLAKSKLGSDETGKRGLDPGVGKGAHKSLQWQHQLIQSHACGTNRVR